MMTDANIHPILSHLHVSEQLTTMMTMMIPKTTMRMKMKGMMMIMIMAVGPRSENTSKLIINCYPQALKERPVLVPAAVAAAGMFNSSVLVVMTL